MNNCDRARWKLSSKEEVTCIHVELEGEGDPYTGKITYEPKRNNSERWLVLGKHCDSPAPEWWLS